MQTETKLEQRIENYWDERSKDFSHVRRLELSGADCLAWEKIIIQHLPQKNNLKILDVGTGAGFFAILLSKLGHQVIGVDRSTKMLREAKKNSDGLNLHAEFLRTDAQNLNFPNETFDVVISRNLTWTLPDVMQAYREWRRVLKIGGVLMNFDSDYGDKDFTNKKTCAKGEVNDEMLAECQNIKDALIISTHRRPIWDINFLSSIGFQVQCDFDISTLVHKDEKISYDLIPLFAIYAKKLSIAD